MATITKFSVLNTTILKKNIVSLQLSGYPDASNTQRNQ